MLRNPCESRGALRGNLCKGAAWLSSARVVRCRVKSLNERNPYLQLPASNVGDSGETAGVKPEEGGMTSSPHGLYVWGCTRPTMQRTKRSETARSSKSHKTLPSSDCRLQFACMKPESLVIVGQNTTVNVFLSLVHTARQATKVGGARSRNANRSRRLAPKVNSMIGTKS